MICAFFESESHFSSFALKKAIQLKKFVVFTMFYSFSLLFPILCPRVNRSLHFLLRRSFHKSDMSDSITGEESELLFCSFAHIKCVIHSKNQRANSQPCARCMILKALWWIIYSAERCMMLDFSWWIIYLAYYNTVYAIGIMGFNTWGWMFYFTRQ